ncbi:MAG: outer membrane beta-barrel protein [Planctomycetia bacterium]|nr:outer membrane beta-barrel protein [Planctomycetia bacterium]
MKKSSFRVYLLLAAAMLTGNAWAGECGLDTVGCGTCANDLSAVSCADPSCTSACYSPLCGIEYNGYINAGGTFGMSNGGAKYNVLNAGSDNTLGLDGAYISVFKKAQNGCGIMDWGFGYDTMFGRDARYLSGYTGWDSQWETGKRSSDFNNLQTLTDGQREGYGFAMPQLYGEFSVNNFTVKAGHFYGLAGYESARADQRFFYAYARNFDVTPITHSGALVSWNGFQNLDVTIGWVNGINNTFENDYDESMLTGAFKYKADCWDVKYSYLVGDGAMYGIKGDRFHNDVVFTRKLNCKWDAAFMYNYGSFNGDEAADAGDYYYSSVTDMMHVLGTDNVDYQTFAGYLFYTWNPCWKFGLRTEWQKGSTDIADGETFETNLFNVGLGANWSPMVGDNLIVRPEIRYDSSDQAIFGAPETTGDRDGLKKSQYTLAFDVLYKF